MQNKVYTDHLQLTLPIEFAPSVVRAHGLSVAHPRPLVSYGKDYGRVFCFRTSPRKAWRYAEVEYANAGSSYGALALDCDDADAYARGFLRSEIPPPNWRVFRPDTGHSHAVWTLAVPVHKYPKARRGPLDYFAAIAEFYALTLGADAGYHGVLVHNPVSTPYETRWGPELPYPAGTVGAGDSVRLARAGRTTDWRGPELRPVPGRHGVGRTRGERSPRRACRAAHRQSAIRASSPAVGSANHGAGHREVPRAVDGATAGTLRAGWLGKQCGGSVRARCGVSAR